MDEHEWLATFSRQTCERLGVPKRRPVHAFKDTGIGSIGSEQIGLGIADFDPVHRTLIGDALGDEMCRGAVFRKCCKEHRRGSLFLGQRLAAGENGVSTKALRDVIRVDPRLFQKFEVSIHHGSDNNHRYHGWLDERPKHFAMQIALGRAVAGQATVDEPNILRRMLPHAPLVYHLLGDTNEAILLVDTPSFYEGIAYD